MDLSIIAITLGHRSGVYRVTGSPAPSDGPGSISVAVSTPDHGRVQSGATARTEQSPMCGPEPAAARP